jgi:hypothetical protein
VTEQQARSPRRRLVIGTTILACAVGLVGIANVEVTTKQGLNYEVSTHRLPLYLKMLQFMDRSAQYQQIAEEVTRGSTSDAERVLKVFDWTRRHIKWTPDGWPIVDDHVLNIIIRGHGVNDQQADVFTTLTTYAGVPAFWSRVPLDHELPGVLLAFARVDDRWRVFDVALGVVFRTPAGGLAALDDIAVNPAIIPESVRMRPVEQVTYSQILRTASMPPVPRTLRAELQMPVPRVLYEMKAAIGFETKE